jgi:hypothetical protein
MKIWFDKDKTDLNIFKSEKFLLIPFLKKEIINTDNDFKNANEWIEFIAKYVQFVSESDADVFVYHDKLDTEIGKTIQLANKYNKKIIAFYNDDNGTPTALPDCVDLYRTSLYKSKQKSNEFSLPAWSADFGSTNLLIRKKEKMPIIGFCGAFTHPLREAAINQLRSNTAIETNFVIRNNYWGGNIHNQQIRAEYINNINNSDLILCSRGAGNFSYRLYESMSLGRVPIIINTDIVLPCNDVINWKEISVWVDDVMDINNEINRFWSNLTDKEYFLLQRKIRGLYERYISPAGFTHYLNLKYTDDADREIQF